MSAVWDNMRVREFLEHRIYVEQKIPKKYSLNLKVMFIP